jgi:hypothetical protein
MVWCATREFPEAGSDRGDESAMVLALQPGTPEREHFPNMNTGGVCRMGVIVCRQSTGVD